MTHVVHQPNEGGDWIRSKVFDRRSATEAPSTGGADDQTAAEVPITDSGAYFTGTDVEAALQELGADVVALGAGIVNGCQYVIDTGSTADSDPGAGLLKFNHATQASATVLYLDDTTSDTIDMTALWAALTAGGFLRIQSATDQDTWQLWKTGTITDAAGYVKIAVTLMANGGSFADADPVFVTIGQGASASSGGGEWTFVERITLGAAGADIASSTAWDLATYSRYRVVFNVKNDTATATYGSIYLNGDTTATNYNRRLCTTAEYTGNDAQCLTMRASACNTGEIIISRDLDGYPRAHCAEYTGTTTAPEKFEWVLTRNNTANVTSMKLTYATNFAIGSYMDIYRKT